MLTNYQRYRLYEIMPGALIWATLIGSVALSYFAPLAMMYVVIVFDIYWVLRVVYFSLYVLVSWRRFRQAVGVAWFERLKQEFPRWKETHNVVFLPVYNESFAVLSATLNALLASTFPARELTVVISGEERQMTHWQALSRDIERAYAGVFKDLLFYTHPASLPDEIPGKGSNLHHAEKEFRRYADQHGWAYERIIVSMFDVDTVVHPEYLAHLQYMYLKHPNPTRSSFQPVTLYNNNLWDSHAILRIMAFGTTFWMMFSLARLDTLVTFSSHSMSFKALVDVGGHAKAIVSEDSRIFFQCWLHYNGDYEVTPLYIPVSMDTVHDDTIGKSLKNLYYQQRRWAWGVEHIPYLWQQFKIRPLIPWHKKAVLFFHELEGKWSWAVVAIFITIMGRLPLVFADYELRQTLLFFTTPYVLQILMTIAMIGLFVSAILSVLMLPKRPESHPPHRYVFMILQWILLPVSLIFFSAVPCLDAVTHLMRGKYLGFNVSKKRS